MKSAVHYKRYFWRGIDWREVSRIEGEDGVDVVVFFKDDREPLTLNHYPGEGTFARAEVELHMARRGPNE